MKLNDRDKPIKKMIIRGRKTEVYTVVSVNKFLVILTVPFPVKVRDDTAGTLSISNNKTDINLLLLWRCEFYALGAIAGFAKEHCPLKMGTYVPKM